MKRPLVGKFLVAGLSAAFMCGALTIAQGDTIEQIRSVPSTLTDWNEALTFDKFNTSLGTLESVTFTITTTVQTVISVTNNGSSLSTGSVRTEITFTLLDPQGYFDGDNPFIDSMVPTQAVSFSVNAGETKPYGPYTRNLSTPGGYTYTTSQVLAEFSGSSTDDILLTLETFSQTLIATQAANTSATQSTTASGNVTLTYSYSAVPEPSTVALAVLGALVVIIPALRRRLA